MTDSDTPSFQSLGLSDAVLKALQDVGYENPSAIQAACIPHLIEGHDLLGQAQTGTGKTAAFALPFLSQIDLKSKNPQLLVLAPTRELAIQVAEAFQSYARHIKGFHVLPIYGGQSYDIQLRQLKRGVHVVVGTPGRVMDHIRRKTLKLNELRSLVLDEADEMLRMGFLDDVEWILEHTPKERQIALFSATMPKEIQRVAEKHLNEPKLVKIAASTATAKTIQQRFWQVAGPKKLAALTRILEIEEMDAMIIFVRTKNATLELAEKLSARGYACEALNGDIPQKNREKVVSRLKRGSIDILVATDVVARGLDVERISHVINYDIPHDTESYIHRIGRTGRAGRSGQAILFITSRERRLLKAIERATKQPIEEMEMPSASDINEQRMNKFKQRISDTLASQDLQLFTKLVTEYEQEYAVEPLRIAAALACIAQGKTPLLFSEQKHQSEKRPEKKRKETKGKDQPKRERDNKPKKNSRNPLSLNDVEMERFRIEVGLNDGVKPANIVGAIANEVDLDSDYIGHIEILDSYSTVDLPADMPKQIMQILRKTWVSGKRMGLRKLSSNDKKRGKKQDNKSSKKPRKSDKSGKKPSAKSRKKPKNKK